MKYMVATFLVVHYIIGCCHCQEFGQFVKLLVQSDRLEIQLLCKNLNEVKCLILVNLGSLQVR